MDSQQKEKLQNLFKQTDKDGSGFLNHDEIKSALKQIYEGIDLRLTDSQIDQLIAQVDSNNDGKVQYDEFIKLI